MEVCSDTVECKVSAKRMWHAYYVDAHNCLPKAAPHAISHVSYDDGPHSFSAGFCRTIYLNASFAETIAKEKNTEVLLHMKEKVEWVDHQALKLKVEVLEGGFVGTLVKYAKKTVHIKEGDTPNTCVVHWSFEYEALSESHKPRVQVAVKEYITRSYKYVEEYLLSHDDYKEV